MDTDVPQQPCACTEGIRAGSLEGVSEVARLRQLITAEYEAAVHGFSGLTVGTAKHAFIDARMKRVWDYGEQLATHVGEAEATCQLCELYTETIG